MPTLAVPLPSGTTPWRWKMTKLLDEIHPGEIQLASHIDVSPIRISELVNGLRPVTADTALRLGLLFGMDAQYWLNLHSEYTDAARLSFNSGEALVRLLTPGNRALLALIRDRKPEPVAALAKLPQAGNGVCAPASQNSASRSTCTPTTTPSRLRSRKLSPVRLTLWPDSMRPRTRRRFPRG